MSAYGFSSFEPPDDYSPEPDRCHACGDAPGAVSSDCACSCDALLWLENAAQHIQAAVVDAPAIDAGLILANAWIQVSRGMRK